MSNKIVINDDEIIQVDKTVFLSEEFPVLEFNDEKHQLMIKHIHKVSAVEFIVYLTRTDTYKLCSLLNFLVGQSTSNEKLITSIDEDDIHIILALFEYFENTAERSLEKDERKLRNKLQSIPRLY